MSTREELIKALQMPHGKKIKDKLDNYLNQYINKPLAEAGHEDAGAAISALLSASGEMLIPDDLADAALSVIPGGRLVKSGKKGMKKLIPGLEKSGTIDYKAIRDSEEAIRRRGQDVAEKNADTLFYVAPGKPIRVKGKDKFDYELAEEEAKKKLDK